MLGELIKRHKLAIAFLGDVIVFVLSLILVLYLRYGNETFMAQLSVHREPFIVVLILWLIIFYIANLYTYKAFSNTLEISRSLITTVLISFFINITIFYIFSRYFNLTPKVNLVIFSIVFLGLDMLWRYSLRKIFIRKEHCRNVLMMASSPLVKSVNEYIDTNPHLGYSVYFFNDDIKTLIDFIQKNSIALIVIDGHSLKNATTARTLYGLISKDVEIVLFTDFYESLFRCIPLAEVEEEWFIREITENKSIYESVKRLIEVVAVIITVPITIPLIIIIGILVRVTSRGPVIYKQERTGKNNKLFTLYKFRTMVANHNGPLWTEEKDNRVTFFGKILRHSHFDEIPQLWNVLKGDISFIGPRPERSKLVKMYETIPYYEIRHIIKPGVIGWAQLNYKPSTSIDEAQEKFQFDLYYLKNRSFILDLFIIIKTVRMVFLKNK